MWRNKMFHLWLETSWKSFFLVPDFVCLIDEDKYLDGFSKMVPILNAYDRQVPDRTVMAFVPNEELRQVTFAAEHI